MPENWSTPTGKIAEALLNAQLAMKHPAMDSVNPHFDSKFASLKSVTDAALAALNANGIAICQELREAEGGVHCYTHLLHTSGEKLVFGPLFMPASKANAHGYGSACSYARRYSIASVMCLVADPDDDGNAAVSGLDATAERGKANKAKNDKNKLAREHRDHVTYIIEAVEREAPEDVAAAWAELSNEAKEAVWPLFNSKEKKAIQTARSLADNTREDEE